MLFLICKELIEIFAHILQLVLFMKVIVGCKPREDRKFKGIIFILLLAAVFLGVQTGNRVLYLSILLFIQFCIAAFGFYGNYLRNGMIYLCSEFAWFTVDLYFWAILLYKESQIIRLEIISVEKCIGIQLFRVFVILIIDYGLRNLQKRRVKQGMIKRLPIYYYIILGSFLFFGYIGFITINVSKGLKDNPSLGQLLLISIGVLCVIFIISGSAMISLNVSRNVFEIQSRLKTEYAKTQNQFYKEIYKGNLEIQRFRFDTYQHMSSMKGLLLEKKYSELEDYMHTFHKRMQKAITQKINSNNEMVDAVLNHLIYEGKEIGIPIYILGNLPEEVIVNSHDLCAIFSNALINSLNACKEMSDRKKCYVEVSIKSFRHNLFISITHTVSKVINGTIFERDKWKEDISASGIRIRTIFEAVKRNGGEIEFKNVDNTFVMEILFYDVISAKKP